jgi:hypothetical protein
MSVQALSRHRCHLTQESRLQAQKHHPPQLQLLKGISECLGRVRGHPQMSGRTIFSCKIHRVALMQACPSVHVLSSFHPVLRIYSNNGSPGLASPSTSRASAHGHTSDTPSHGSVLATSPAIVEQRARKTSTESLRKHIISSPTHSDTSRVTSSRSSVLHEYVIVFNLISV